MKIGPKIANIIIILLLLEYHYCYYRGGGFKNLLFSPLLGEMLQFD